jgi:hypothetical protein
MNKVLYLISMSFLLFSCSKKDNPVKSSIAVDYGNVSGAIFLSSFETSGDTTLSDWYIPLSYSRDDFNFSNDVPNHGGYWSLNIKGTEEQDYANTIEWSKTISDSDLTAYYELSFLAKGVGFARIFFKDSTGGWLLNIPVEATGWTLFTDTLSRRALRYNTLEVSIGGSMNDSLSSLFVDNVKVLKK